MVSSGERDNLSGAATARVLQLPVKQKVADTDSGAVLDLGADPAGTDLAREYERFQLQVRLDVENERELLYKSLLVVEILAFLFVLREVLIRWLA